jgi:hypothetical protein
VIGALAAALGGGEIRQDPGPNVCWSSPGRSIAKESGKIFFFFFLTDYKTVPTIGITLFIRIARTMRNVRLKDSVGAFIALLVFLCIATRSRESATL